MCRGTDEPYTKRVCGVLKKDLRERRKFAAQTRFLHQVSMVNLLSAANGEEGIATSKVRNSACL